MDTSFPALQNAGSSNGPGNCSGYDEDGMTTHAHPRAADAPKGVTVCHALKTMYLLIYTRLPLTQPPRLRQGEAGDTGRITPPDNVFKELIIEKLHGIRYKGVL
jgi:hypothetical protein